MNHNRAMIKATIYLLKKIVPTTFFIGIILLKKLNCRYLIKKIIISTIYSFGFFFFLKRLPVNEDFFDLLAQLNNYLGSTLKGLKRKKSEKLRSAIKVYPSPR